jgi:hypothetical protein
MTSQIPSEQNLAVPEETERRSQLVLRTLPILLIPVFSAIATFLLVSLTMRNSIPELAAAQSARPPGVVGIIVLAIFFTALIILVRLGRPTVSALLLIGVWTLITTLVTLRGGVASIGPAFLVIPICAGHASGGALRGQPGGDQYPGPEPGAGVDYRARRAAVELRFSAGALAAGRWRF